jgi:hypothetical protein
MLFNWFKCTWEREIEDDDEEEIKRDNDIKWIDGKIG